MAGVIVSTGRILGRGPAGYGLKKKKHSGTDLSGLVTVDVSVWNGVWKRPTENLSQEYLGYCRSFTLVHMPT